MYKSSNKDEEKATWPACWQAAVQSSYWIYKQLQVLCALQCLSFIDPAPDHVGFTIQLRAKQPGAQS